MGNNIKTNLFTINVWVATLTLAFFKGKVQPWTYSQLNQKQNFTLALKDIAEEELNKIHHNFTFCLCLEEMFVKDYSSFYLYLPCSRPSLWILICSKTSKEKNHTICPSARALFCLASHFRCRYSSTCLALSTASCPLCLDNIGK